MIKALIIDDEKDARFILRNLLERNYKSQVLVLGEAEDVEPGYEAIKAHKPDVVFLDIRMISGTGFDLLNKFDQIDFEIVFVTAHNQFAVEAFKSSAFGYILKPIKNRDLGEIIQKLETQLYKTKNEINSRLKVLIENYGNDGEVKKLVIPNIEGFQVVKLSEIIRLEGDSNYTNFILTNNKRIVTSKTLGEYEGLLNENGFFRIHQSTIVNLSHISAFLKAKGGSVETSDGCQMKVSRYRKAEFINRFF